MPRSKRFAPGIFFRIIVREMIGIMEKAKTLADFYGVFYPVPLKESEMDSFYCDTIKFRTGDEYVSPMGDIYRIMKNNRGGNAFLLLGHKGCGKSTELVKLASDFTAEGYRVESTNCRLEMDMQNAVYWDLFILITQKLIKIADALKCDIGKAVIKRALSYWDDRSIVESVEEELGYALESEVSAGAGLKGLFGAFLKITGDIKNKSGKRTELRKNVERRASEWMEILNSISLSIQNKSDGKMPILIFEDLDKISQDKALEIFYNNANALSQLPVKAIYTFPINLYYSEKFTALKSYFIHKTLPMIKVHNKDMSENKEGVGIIKDIVYKRADENLFERGVLDEMIKKTGGVLRDLFEVILNAANRADNRKSEKISMADAAVALTSLKSDLKRMIKVSDFDFLKNVYNKKEQIQDSEETLKFMQALIVLEYNGDNWHDLHPLIHDFLFEQGILGDG